MISVPRLKIAIERELKVVEIQESRAKRRMVVPELINGS